MDFWVRSWTNDDLTGARRLLAPDVEAEWNLDAPVDEEEDHGAHGDFDRRPHTSSLQLWADQHRAWIASAGALGGFCDAACHGVSKLWRGGFLGLSLGLLGTLGIAALTRRDEHAARSGTSGSLPTPAGSS